MLLNFDAMFKLKRPNHPSSLLSCRANALVYRCCSIIQFLPHLPDLIFDACKNSFQIFVQIAVCFLLLSGQIDKLTCFSNDGYAIIKVEPRYEKTCLREFPTRTDSNWPAQLQKLA